MFLTPTVVLNIRFLWPTLLAIAVLCGFALRTGSAFVFYGLACPDTCWLVALGAITSLSGSIPKIDPFSFTLPMLAQQGNPQPFVIYQWLAELVFYFASRIFGMPGLLIMAAVVATFAYIALPLRFCIRANAFPLWSILAVSATCAAGNLRSNIRPEIFSSFFIAMWLSIILPANRSSTDRADSPSWIKIASLTVIMLFWVNLHSGFVYGLVLLLIYTVAGIVDDVTSKRSFSGTTKTLGIALLTSTLITLANPYGLGLWMYLPRLFLTPIVEGIDETMPLSTILSKTERILPIACVIVLCLGAIGWIVFRQVKSNEPRPNCFWVNLGVVCLAAASCLFVLRLTSFSAIIMTMVTAAIIGKNGERIWPDKFWNKAVSYFAFELALVLCAAQGVTAVANRTINLSLPEATIDFTPPFDEVRSFIKSYNDGNVLASLPVADMLDLYFGAHRCLFLDTRFDAYPKDLVNDYFVMIQASDNYETLLDKYKIEWAFLTPNERLGAVLEHNPKWSPVIHNNKALIFKRVETIKDQNHVVK